MSTAAQITGPAAARASSRSQSQAVARPRDLLREGRLRAGGRP